MSIGCHISLIGKVSFKKIFGDEGVIQGDDLRKLYTWGAVGVGDHLHLKLDLRWLDEKVNHPEGTVMINSSTWGKYI